MRISDLLMLKDINDEYLLHRRNGCNREAATNNVISSYQNELTLDPEGDALIVWIGLADAQLGRRELTTSIAQKALQSIEMILSQNWTICRGDLLRRQKKYQLAPMPERAVRQARRKFRCTWADGDTFAYKLSGPDAEEVGIAGRYALLRKVGTTEEHDGSAPPVVTVSIWDKEILPTSAEEFASVPLLKLMRGGRLSSPLDKYEYRTEIFVHSEKQLQSIPLIYLGNFQDTPLPSDEIIFLESYALLTILPDRMDYIISAYYKRNLEYTSHHEQPF